MIIASLFASKGQNLKPAHQQPSVLIPFNKCMSFPTKGKNIPRRYAMTKEKGTMFGCMLKLCIKK